MVLPLSLVRAISSALAASPSSILKLSTWNYFPRDDDYHSVSVLFTTLQSLHTVEFIIRTHAQLRTAPSDETLIKIGERTMLRNQGERWVRSLELVRDVVVLTVAGRASALGNTVVTRSLVQSERA